MPAERERRTFGRSLGRADESSDNDRERHYRAAVPRRRGIGPRRGRMHLEVVPETRVSSGTPGLRAMMAAAERQSHRLSGRIKGGAPETHIGSRGAGIRTQEGVWTKSVDMESPTTCPVQWTQPLRRKREGAKAKEKAKAASGRRQDVQNEQQGAQAWLSC